MPLQLNHTEPRTGVTHPASYWAIERAQFWAAPNIQPPTQKSEFIIAGWHTVTQYNAGAEPYMRKAYRFNQLPAGSQTFAAVVTSLYAWVQANPDENNVMFFAGATVVP